MTPSRNATDVLETMLHRLRNRSLAAKQASTHGTPARASSPDPATANGHTEDTAALVSESIESDAKVDSSINVRAFDESLDTAFQLTTLRGPLCHEPVQGMAYFVERLEVNADAAGGGEARTSISSADPSNSGIPTDSVPSRACSVDPILASDRQPNLLSAGSIPERAAGLVSTSASSYVFMRHPSFE